MGWTDRAIALMDAKSRELEAKAALIRARTECRSALRAAFMDGATAALKAQFAARAPEMDEARFRSEMLRALDKYPAALSPETDQ